MMKLTANCLGFEKKFEVFFSVGSMFLIKIEIGITLYLFFKM